MLGPMFCPRRLVLTAAHCVTPVLQGVEAPLVLMGKVAVRAPSKVVTPACTCLASLA